MAENNIMETIGDCPYLFPICSPGRPLGTDGFLSKLEKLLGRRVRALPVGRQFKNADNMKKQV